jgi:CRP/FNR family transcriptional regulator, cyclic AMP receptor protein
MTLFDFVGYLASALVLFAFCMRAMIPLRTVALCSNIGFLLYGFNHALMPVVLLHAVLLPVNGWRLWEALRNVDTAQQTSDIVAQSSISSGRLP